jgi:hypothetical protein
VLVSSGGSWVEVFSNLNPSFICYFHHFFK